MKFMSFFICLVALYFFLSVSQVNAEEIQSNLAQSKELWTGRIYSSTFKAGFCLNNKDVRGVAQIKTFTGKVDVYHFYGTFENGIIDVNHNSGHNFKGTFISDTEVQGVLVLKNKHSIKVKAARSLNATLTETCQPLDN